MTGYFVFTILVRIFKIIAMDQDDSSQTTPDMDPADHRTPLRTVFL